MDSDDLEAQLDQVILQHPAEPRESTKRKRIELEEGKENGPQQTEELIEFEMPDFEMEHGRTSLIMSDEEVSPAPAPRPLVQQKEEMANLQVKRRRIEVLPKELDIDDLGPELMLTQRIEDEEIDADFSQQPDQFNANTRRYHEQLRKEFDRQNITPESRKSITFQQTIMNLKRRQAAARFLDLLLLVTAGALRATQNEAYHDIFLRKTQNFEV